MNARVMLFRNPGGTYWAGRPSADLNTNTIATYVAPTSGTYAVVVVNDDAGTASFSLGIGACATLAALTAGVVSHTDLLYTHNWFNQAQVYWTAVGVRSTTQDYDISVWGGTAGPGYPTCLSDMKAGSTYSPPRLDFVVGDFNHNPVGTYYVQTYDYSGGPGGGDIQWDSGADQLAINGAPLPRSTGPGNVLEVCRANGLLARETTFSLTDVYNAAEAFVTGTFAGVVPVRTVDGRRIGTGARGPVVERLQRLYQDHVAADVAARSR